MGSPAGNGFAHQPVLLEEVLAALNLKSGGVYVDCTVGGAGHSLAILRRTGPDGWLIGLDQDPDALAAAADRLAPYARRLNLFRENFVNLPRVLTGLGVEQVDGLLYDLGVSSPQLDRAGRGFSYLHDGPLDMRMDPGGGVTAGELVNTLPERELAAVIRDYGEERWASRIASFIVRERRYRPLKTTFDLVALIKKAVPAAARRTGPHPARRTFQALRIAVNRELEILPGALREAVGFLRPGGRICVITFHSLEDRVVKKLFRELSSPCICPPQFPVCVCGRVPVLRLVVPYPAEPSAKETADNPRARSARLRAAEKTGLVLNQPGGA
ncbi:16S rRNA (cytosine(1402)-N(4))-methyltransferase RsmH [Desulfotomaculum copahuensis]|uniref:Ribosomal RNA small subunit methyltransferase H n=1 Tax=Desulfotomaculum copahuensis TaxID=1838280 RepID=A0A1B7LEZ1_9FIRM|nr:16S rRNA (cytosine(1402)-N(4))-methyltransferase RsmH [Desulfotomaculum copahuensis]OAT81853.1 16S rRNA (cytosine(1402)-N(4))-methyltransferase [Desulfotomaculum copahuensis]